MCSGKLYRSSIIRLSLLVYVVRYCVGNYVIRVFLIPYAKNPDLVVSSSANGILPADIAMLFAISFSDSGELLLAIAVFTNMIVQLPSILSLLFRVYVLVILWSRLTSTCGHSEALTEGVMLKTSPGIVRFVVNLAGRGRLQVLRCHSINSLLNERPSIRL